MPAMITRVRPLWAWSAVLVLALAWAEAEAAPARPRAPDSAKVKALLEERRDALRKVVKARMAEFDAGRGTLALLLDYSARLLQAELETAGRRADRIAAHQAHLGRMKKCEEQVSAWYRAGRVTFADYHSARAARLDAEIGWLRAGGKPKKAGK
jgi:hypothetical protein